MIPLKTIIMTSLLLANGSVFALQTLDDSSLSQATGQDGITVTLQDFEPNAQIIWTDTNGINSADGIDPANIGIVTTTPQPGAVVFGDGTRANNFRISKGTTTLTLDVDGNNGSPMLNINISLPEDMMVQTGDIFVAGKDNNNQLVNMTKIMNDVKVELGGLDLNVQLGSASQGQLLKLYGTIVGGIRISNLALISDSSGTEQYGIGIQKITVRDTGTSGDLTFNGSGVSVANTGLIITPSAGKQIDVLMDDLKVGNLASSASIGGVAVLGMQLDGTSLTISGH